MIYIGNGISLAMSFGILVSNLDIPCPLQFFADAEAVAVIISGSFLGFGFLLNPIEDTKWALSILGHLGLELFNFLKS